MAVDEDGSRLYGAGGSGANTLSAWNADTCAKTWSHRAMGDIQAVEFHESTVYFGFHEGFQGDTKVRTLAAAAATGALDPSFRPAFDKF